MAEPSERSADASWPRRYSWPMRLFLCYFIGDMIFRSLLSLTPYNGDWSDEFHVELYPTALPTPAELRRIAADPQGDGYRAATDRIWTSLASIGPYFSPVPSDATRGELKSPVDAGKYAITWAVSRLQFVGVLVGVDQGWPMFSPNVGAGDTMGRLRLVFADGATRLYRQCADPVDLTCYGHWFKEKHIQVALKVHNDNALRLGYCRWLSRQFPQSDAGSPLVRIEVFKIRYEYPSPSDDASAFLAAQTGPPADQQEPTFWIYDVATRTGKYVE